MNNKQELNQSYANIHETEIKDEDYIINYDPGEVFEKKFDLNELILRAVGTTGSALCSGRYAGHGFGLQWYHEFLGCEWVVKKHIDWNHNVSQILIPLKKGVIAYPDDEEKIAYRMMLQKILRTTSSLDDIKIHIGYLLDNYSKQKANEK